MKKVVLISLILMQNICFAQASVVGIGNFKVGKTNISIIDSVLKELNTSTIISYDDVTTYEYSNEPNKVYELKKDSLNPMRSYTFSTECKGFRVFYISTYKVSDILIEDIYLTFKDNILYSLMAKSKELYNALKVKYPKFKESREDEKTNCVVGDLKDARFDFDTTFKTTWSNGSVEAEITESYYYSKECKRRHFDYINISKMPHIFLPDCDAKINKSREIKAKKALKDKLKDL